jgi:DNA-binding PadR family transcriptional regulator
MADDLKTTILKMFKNSEFHGYEAHKRLITEGVEMDISRLYRVLNEMLSEGLLEGRWERSLRGPRMRVYRLGEGGRKELDRIFRDAIDTTHYFYSEYLMSLPPEVNAFNIISRRISSNLKAGGNIVFVASQYSAPIERIIRGLHDEAPEAKIILVKPECLTIELKLDNLVFMEGTYTSIPLRDGYAALLYIVNIPTADSLEKALGEWCRVLGQSGTLAIATPTINVEKHKDPLTIGDFMERYEHEGTAKGVYVDKSFVEETLKKSFHRVTERQIIHLTIFLASEKLPRQC